MKNKKRYFQIIGILLFIFVIFKIDAIKSLKVILDSNIYLVAVSIFFIFPIVASRSLRWELLLNSQGIKNGFWESFLAYFNAIFWGAITPAKMGEFSKIALLKRKGLSVEQSIPSIIMDRVMDVVFIMVVGLAGFILFFGQFKSAIWLLSSVLIIMTFFILLCFFEPSFAPRRLKKILKYIAYSKYDRPFFTFLSGIILTVFSWLLYFFQIYLMAIAIGLKIPFFTISVMTSVVSALSFLPITVSGIGTRDAAFIYFFNNLGYAKEEAVSLSLLILLTFVINGLFGWLAGFFIKKEPFEMRKNNINPNKDIVRSSDSHK